MHKHNNILQVTSEAASNHQKQFQHWAGKLCALLVSPFNKTYGGPLLKTLHQPKISWTANTTSKKHSCVQKRIIQTTSCGLACASRFVIVLRLRILCFIVVLRLRIVCFVVVLRLRILCFVFVATESSAVRQHLRLYIVILRLCTRPVASFSE